MTKLKIVLGLLVVALGLGLAWRAGSAELANTELQDDLVDMAAQLGQQSGLEGPRSDEELRAIVMRKAGKYGIHLRADQVTVRQDWDRKYLYLAADYDARIGLPGFSLARHFTPSSANK
jgi:hypothetical protein